MSEWQDIKTAPKDTPILAYRDRASFGIGCRIIAVMWHADTFRGTWIWPDGPYDEYDLNAYREASDNDDYFHTNNFTHWQPLPEPPK